MEKYTECNERCIWSLFSPPLFPVCPDLNSSNIHTTSSLPWKPFNWVMLVEYLPIDFIHSPSFSIFSRSSSSSHLSLSLFGFSFGLFFAFRFHALIFPLHIISDPCFVFSFLFLDQCFPRVHRTLCMRPLLHQIVTRYLFGTSLLFPSHFTCFFRSSFVFLLLLFLASFGEWDGRF